MHKFLLIIILFPMLLNAQNKDGRQLYVSAQDQITTQIKELKCVLNNEFSHGYTRTYDCRAPDGKVEKQLSLGIHLASIIHNNKYAAFIKHQSEYGEYLLGEF